MARERDTVRKTTTIEHVPSGREGDPTAHTIREGLREFARMDVSGYCEAYWKAVNGVDDARLDVFKKLSLSGRPQKVGFLETDEIPALDVESELVTRWGIGTYQLRPIIGGKYYSPASMQLRIGESADAPTAPRGSDLAGAISAIAELGIVKQVQELKDGLLAGATKGDGEMRPEAVQAMITTSIRPFEMMVEAANRRAEAAETANRELTSKMMDMAMNRSNAGAAGVPDLLKLLPKDALSALLSPPEGPGWVEKAVDALREFGPALTAMVMQYLQGGAGAVGVNLPAALPPGPATTETQGNPQPTEETGRRAMPLQLNPEQQDAKALLLECVKGRDFPNAFAMLENFPGYVPSAQGMLPIGAAFLGGIDSTVTKPRIYVIQLMQLAPEFRECLAEADAFVAYIQKRLMDDQEAAVREQPRAATGPTPTRGEDDR